MITCFMEECNTFSQTDYDNAINRLPFHMLRCSCGRHGCLIKHGYYIRTLKLTDHTVFLRVLRVKCKECGKTHALLFTCIVPYSQVSMPEHISIIENHLENKSNKELLDLNPDISERDIRYIITKYCKYWHQRILSSALSIAYTFPFISSCFSHFRYNFMQIRCTFNSLFPSPT